MLDNTIIEAVCVMRFVRNNHDGHKLCWSCWTPTSVLAVLVYEKHFKSRGGRMFYSPKYVILQQYIQLSVYTGAITKATTANLAVSTFQRPFGVRF